MKGRDLPRFRYPTGVALESGAYVVVQVSDAAGRATPGSLLADYRFSPDPDGFARDWTVVCIQRDAASGTVVALGQAGEFIRIRGDEVVDEVIDASPSGPTRHGPLRGVRSVGDTLFAFGMGRQVYQRSASHGWKRFDDEVLDFSGEVVSGFTAVATDGQGGLFAVGYKGEIWRRTDRWRREDSPTNLLLTDLVWRNGELFAVGLSGVVLTWSGSGWRVVDVGSFNADVWRAETFGGRLYLGTSRGLFRLTEKGDVEDVGLATKTGQAQCGALSAGFGRLWCFGGERISSSEDGDIWRSEQVFSSQG